jgi:excisionase family DNA binding protein
MSALQTNLNERAREIEAELKAAGVAAVLTADQAAEALGLEHPRTVARMIARGELVAFSIGNRHRIRRAALAQFIAAREK